MGGVSVAAPGRLSRCHACIQHACAWLEPTRIAGDALNAVLTPDSALPQSSTPRSSPARPSRLSAPSTRRLASADFGVDWALVFLWSEPSPPSSGYVVSVHSNRNDLDAFAHSFHFTAHLRHVQGHHGSPDHWLGRSGPHQEVSVVLTAMPSLSSSSPSSPSYRRLLESFHPTFSTPMSLYSSPLNPSTPPPQVALRSVSRLCLFLYEKMSTELFCSNWSCGLMVCGTPEYADWWAAGRRCTRDRGVLSR